MSRVRGFRIVLVLVIGVVLGWMPSGFRPAPMRASAGDRAGECIVATGPVLMQYDNTTKAPIPLDAVYFLDYKGGRLLATVPTYRLGRDEDADHRRFRRAGPGRRFQARAGRRRRDRDS